MTRPPILASSRDFWRPTELSTRVKRRWQQGEPPDVTGVLASHPELRHYRSVVLDLAYTEYRLRLQAGEPIDAETFAQRFPSLQRSLYLLIEVHGLLSQDPELQDLQESMSWPEAGSRFLQFDLVAEIGRGAFGRVFLATEPAIGGRQIVVKIAPHGGGEAEILGKLRHPNIVPIYSLQEDEANRIGGVLHAVPGASDTLRRVGPVVSSTDVPRFRHERSWMRLRPPTATLTLRNRPPPASILRKGSYVDGVIHLACPTGRCPGAFPRTRHLPSGSEALQRADDSEGRPLLLDFNLSIDAGLPAWKVGGTLPYMPPEELANLVRSQGGFPSPALRSPLGPVLVGSDRLRVADGQASVWGNSAGLRLGRDCPPIAPTTEQGTAANPRAEQAGRSTFGSIGRKLLGIRAGVPS